MIKNSNKITPITLTPFHLEKLKLICQRSGLSKTGVIQRLIEEHNVFDINKDKKESPLTGK